MGQCMVPESDRCAQAHVGGDRSAFAGKISREWYGQEHAGVPRGISLRGERGDGESERVQGMVGKRRSLIDSRWSTAFCDGRVDFPDDPRLTTDDGLPRCYVGLLVGMIAGTH